MYTKFFIIFLFSFVLILCAGEKDRFSEMSPQKIDKMIKETSAKQQTITEKMNFYSQYFLGTPYAFTCVGDGEDALYETYPLVNFDSTNCMAFCEHVLALSVSDSWDNFFNNLQQIRYKDGLIGMRTRNHYTMGDWLPENNWLLDDVSRKVGGSYTKTVTRTISHSKFFKGKGIDDLRHVKTDYEMTIDYIPREAILEIQSNLQNGDIGALIFANKTDIFSAHMWMVMVSDGQHIIRESTTRGMTTIDTPYTTWAERIKNSERYIGITLMRVRDDINQTGKIIYPWDIAELKNNPKSKIQNPK
jgi:hypothetical protein